MHVFGVKSSADHANIDFVLPELLRELDRKLPQECAASSTPMALDDLLHKLACTPALDEGDVLYFGGNVYHRTQDNAGERISIQVTPD